MRIAFVCVQNAGRSQMASAFAEQKREARNLDKSVEILTGGTQPASSVHKEVVTVMDEAGFDISTRTPREITFEELQSTDIVITMGCSADDVCPANWSGENRDWDLEDPHGKSLDTVRAIRDEIQARVTHLFDELESESKIDFT